MEENPSKTPSPSHQQCPTPTSSPLPPSAARLWRPAAQRNLRNQCSKLASLRQQWRSSSSAARSHATSLVNAHLSQRYMPTKELGVLGDMPAIRTQASQKLLKQQEVHRKNLLSSYKTMVCVVTEMVKTSKAMRCYLKRENSSSLIQFSGSSEDSGDLGDGGGVPVFTFLPLSRFDNFVDELVQMFESELILKRLLVVEFLSLNCEPSKLKAVEWSDELYSGEFGDLGVCNLYSESEETSVPNFPQTESSKSDAPIPECNPQPSQEILQVYLTTWLAEVKIDSNRVDEIFSEIGEEMHVSFS